jgi:hypothetical protein
MGKPTGSLGLCCHLDDARSAAGRAGGVVALASESGTGGDACEHVYLGYVVFRFCGGLIIEDGDVQ